ncbi:MAG: hypothetical protein H7328_07125 [Bdellovibrio sp.]|nr:hypothetical protein [Bdellovibrio sp.]
MKKSLIALTAVCLLATSAHAESFLCNFSKDPLADIIYNSSTQELSRTSSGKVTSVIRGATLITQAAGQLVVKDKDGETLLALELNHKGSDGMSATVFPYEAMIAQGDRLLNGGCESDTLKAKAGERLSVED